MEDYTGNFNAITRNGKLLLKAAINDNLLWAVADLSLTAILAVGTSVFMIHCHRKTKGTLLLFYNKYTCQWEIDENVK